MSVGCFMERERIAEEQDPIRANFAREETLGRTLPRGSAREEGGFFRRRIGGGSICSWVS